MGRRFKKEIMDSDLTEFMTELARYLLSAGISSSRFAEICRIAYFQAATLSARFGNNRVNKSAIAAMTGLTRSQVREYSRNAASATKLKTKPDRIDNVIDGWLRDPAYSTASYRPKKLRIGGRKSSFSKLVRQYGGDVPARSMLRELVRTRLVKVEGTVAALQSTLGTTPAQMRLRHLACSLVSLLRDENSRSDLPSSFRVLGGEVETPTTSTVGRILLERRSATSLRSLLQELQAAGDAASVESPPSEKRRGRSIRTRILVVSEELASQSLGPKLNVMRRPK
jgi:hypothetical protein